MIDGEQLFNISGMSCQYDKLPGICKDLIPMYGDVAFKYTLIIIVGTLNLIVMVYFILQIRKFLKVKMKEAGVDSIGELLKKR